MNRAHMMYDSADITETTQDVLKHCTMDEINTFYKVLEVYLNLIREDQKITK